MPRDSRFDAATLSAPHSLTALLKDVVGALSDLLVQHVSLARAELRTDIRRFARLAGVLLVMLVPLVLGYGLVMAGLAALLSRRIGVPGGLAGVGGANMLLGFAGVAWVLSRFRASSVAGRTTVEIKRSVEMLTTRPGRAINGHDAPGAGHAA